MCFGNTNCGCDKQTELRKRISTYYESLMYDVHLETERLLTKDPCSYCELNRDRECMIQQIMDAERQSFNRLDCWAKCGDSALACLRDDQLFDAAFRVCAGYSRVCLMRLDRVQCVDEQIRKYKIECDDERRSRRDFNEDYTRKAARSRSRGGAGSSNNLSRSNSVEVKVEWRNQAPSSSSRPKSVTYDPYAIKKENRAPSIEHKVEVSVTFDDTPAPVTTYSPPTYSPPPSYNSYSNRRSSNNDDYCKELLSGSRSKPDYCKDVLGYSSSSSYSSRPSTSYDHCKDLLKRSSSYRSTSSYTPVLSRYSTSSSSKPDYCKELLGGYSSSKPDYCKELLGGYSTSSKPDYCKDLLSRYSSSSSCKPDYCKELLGGYSSSKPDYCKELLNSSRYRSSTSNYCDDYKPRALSASSGNSVRHHIHILDCDDKHGCDEFTYDYCSEF